MIAAFDLATQQTGKGIRSGAFIGVQVQTQAPCGADPAPASEKNSAPEQIMLDAHFVKAPCVSRRINARHAGFQGE